MMNNKTKNFNNNFKGESGILIESNGEGNPNIIGVVKKGKLRLENLDMFKEQVFEQAADCFKKAIEESEAEQEVVKCKKIKLHVKDK